MRPFILALMLLGYREASEVSSFLRMRKWEGRILSKKICVFEEKQHNGESGRDARGERRQE